MSQSKVSRRLIQGIAPEVLDNIYRPRLGAEFAAAFPYLSQLNKAHLVMLARQDILTSGTAGRIAAAAAAHRRRGGRGRSRPTPRWRTLTSTWRRG